MPALDPAPFKGDDTLLELFLQEVANQCERLSAGLLQLERDPSNKEAAEGAMRAAHSVKGAARMVKIAPMATLAHAIEDYLIHIQKGKGVPRSQEISQVLSGVDLLQQIIEYPPREVGRWLEKHSSQLEKMAQQLAMLLVSSEKAQLEREKMPLQASAEIGRDQPFIVRSSSERVVRLAAGTVTSLMGLAGEGFVTAQQLVSLQGMWQQMANRLESIERRFFSPTSLEGGHHVMKEIRDRLHLLRQDFTLQVEQLKEQIHQNRLIAEQLYGEIIASRLRPFSDGMYGFPRMVRDLACQLGKRVRLEVKGMETLVDRDILDQLESPLTHLVRNAIDHGIESPVERKERGKEEEGVIEIEASHREGMLWVTLMDDGRGINWQRVRQQLAGGEHLSQEALQEALFLPGVSTATQVSELSGRGVGLDAVRKAVKEMGGNLAMQEREGGGVIFLFRLPTTRAVVRCLVVEIAEERYAFPLSSLDCVTYLPVPSFLEALPKTIQVDEKERWVLYAAQVLGMAIPEHLKEEILQCAPLVLFAEKYALLVDRLVGERDLVIQELDPRLSRFPYLAAAAIDEGEIPLFILDLSQFKQKMEEVCGA